MPVLSNLIPKASIGENYPQSSLLGKNLHTLQDMDDGSGGDTGIKNSLINCRLREIGQIIQRPEPMTTLKRKYQLDSKKVVAPYKPTPEQ